MWCWASGLLVGGTTSTGSTGDAAVSISSSAAVPPDRP
jgi:hypothetical protein